jgi:tetratricopeptide (TPR) repeat protein
MTRRFRRLPAIGWPDFRSSRTRYALGLAGLLVVLALIPVVIAQSARRAPAGLPDAVRALLQGRYDDVDALTAKLGLQDPFVAATKARALRARGRYQDAETLLRPIAQGAAASEAALELGLLLQMLGRQEATAILTRVASIASSATDAQELARGARALRALGRAQEANAAYRDAVTAAPRDPAIHTGWGELFLEKYQRGEALKSFQMALRDDQKYGPALLGSARALAEENPPQAMALAEQALAINPSDVDAMVFVASQSMDFGKRDDARASIDKALAVNPSSLPARSLLAALAYVEDKKAEFDAEAAKVLAIAPNYGEFYRVVAELAAHNYRFDEAVALARRGVELDAGNARLLKELGVHLLRTGDEPAARRMLEASFKLDDFDVVTYNLLQMMDTLDEFVTVQDGDIILRMDRTEAPVLQDYAMSLAKQSMAALTKRYQFTPKGPILIEMFPKHDDFAVRNFGLPGMIGALGACFGRVITLDSPRARPPGDFQWEATLWHEMAHVYTIQMSNQRVPRWLTEGTSVYEETLERREWGRGMDVMFAGLLNRNETIKLADLDGAFQNPQTISLAYYQASLLVELIVGKFGDAGLHRLLRAYGEGLDSTAALRKALDTSFDELQAEYDQLTQKRFGAMQTALKVPEKIELLKMPLEQLRPLAAEHQGSYPVQLMYGTRLREAGETDEALRVLERAAALVPLAGGEDSAHQQIADIAIEKKDIPRAIAALRALLEVDFENIKATRQLAGLLREQKIADPAVVRPVYERLAALDPFDAEVHGELGRLALQRNDAETAIREFRTVVALGPVDQAAAFTDLAESYFRGGRRAEARKQTLAALEIAPSYERAQDLLLKIAGDRP